MAEKKRHGGKKEILREKRVIAAKKRNDRKNKETCQRDSKLETNKQNNSSLRKMLDNV